MGRNSSIRGEIKGISKNPLGTNKKWVKYLVWNGKVTAMECTDHSYAWSGKIPCTGVRRCIFCGKPE